jgi:hypothetical protein
MSNKEAEKIVDYLRKQAAEDHTALSEKLEAYRNYLIAQLMKFPSC